jgi:hypothetical protein
MKALDLRETNALSHEEVPEPEPGVLNATLTPSAP